MKSISLILCILSLFLSSCKKEHASASCSTIQQAVLGNDKDLMKKEINLICNAIQVQSSVNDPDGLKHSLDELVSRLSSLCGLSVRSLCYFCIDTLPPQSEITISVTTSTGTVTKLIDISYNSNKQLYFVNMHD